MSTVTKQEIESVRLELPRKLYGRSAEMEKLRTAFSDVSQGQQVTVFLSGYAGMGKTALVHESICSLERKNGYFIAGKADQLGQNIPYAPVAAALSSLVRQWMTERQEDLDRCKKRVSRALSRSGKVMTELVPELKWIVGETPDIESLPPSEAQNRFRLVLRSFLFAAAGKDRPLILFLDDLQWADPASVQLLQFLIRDAELPYLLILGVYREAEAAENKALSLLLASYGQADDKERSIALKPLCENQAAEWTAETLGTDPKRVSPLAFALYRKSGGNPFFFRQLLVSLYDGGLLHQNVNTGVWQWDQAAIQVLQPGEDVLMFLMEKLKKLPEETLELLKLASLIGNSFHLETLELITGSTFEKIAEVMQNAVMEGLVVEQGFSLSPLPEKTPRSFEFLHDRVQQAVYTLIPEPYKKQTHLTIGRLLIKNFPAGPPEDKVLPIMDHFNRGLELVSSPLEKMELARYNLMAGRRAKASAAYASAMEYFRSGIALLPQSSWDCAYEISHELHLEYAQTEYLSANVEKAEALFDTVIAHTKTELERAKVYGLKVVLYAGMGRYDQAVQTGVCALDRLGVKLPVPPGPIDFAGQLLLSQLRMRVYMGKPKQASRPESEMRARASELLARLACIISIHNPRAYLFTIIKFSNYATRHGQAGIAAIGYTGYGIIAGSVFERHQKGYELALTGLKLADSCSESYPKCYVNFVMGALVCHWTQPAHTALSYLSKAVEYGVESGDVLLAGYASRFILETGYLCGLSLHELKETLNSTQAFAKRIKHQYLSLNTALYRHVIAFLQDEAAGSLRFDASEFDEKEFLTAMKNDNASQAAYHILKMQLCYISGDYETALTMAKQIKGRMEAVTGFFITAEYVFYETLAITALFDKLPRRMKRQCLSALKNNRRRMNGWARNCKENFLHKYLLILAEMARLRGRREQAMSLYDQAIQEARDNGFKQDEALANELAAKFYISQNRRKIARVYMNDACLFYREWGAYAKANALSGLYGELLPKAAYEEDAKPSIPSADSAVPDSASGSEPDGHSADALHKAILMISRQDDPAGILDGFLRYAINSAGANKGILMLEKEGKLWIEDAVADGVRTIKAGMPVAMETGEGFSRAIVRYVFRTLEKTVWRFGDVSNAFWKDTYPLKEGVLTIACLPVLFRGIPAGVLYLENNRDEGAFTEERMQKLVLLSKQLVTVKKLLHYLEGEQGTQLVRLAEPLTGRETDVLRLIAEGLSNKEIADSLGLTANTVKGYMKSLYGKLGASRRVQVAARAKALGVFKSE